MAGGDAGREWVRYMAEPDPGPFPSHRHCLHLLSPVAFPALLRHPQPIAQGTRHGLPGLWAPLKPSPGQAPALCFPMTHSPVIHPLILPDSPISVTALCAHARASRPQSSGQWHELYKAAKRDGEPGQAPTAPSGRRGGQKCLC